jgi:arylsulfatase
MLIQYDLNHTLSNLGNVSSQINYADWGQDASASPLSGFKTSEYEGGTRVPLIFKEPGISSSSAAASNTSNPEMIKAFAYVTDLTPTFLEYAGVQHPDTSTNGSTVHPISAQTNPYPIMGKSLKALFNGTADRVYGENDVVADEMFNNSAVWMGDWKAIRHEPPVGDGKWQLINVTDDPSEINNVADQHPEIMQKMISAYDTYAQQVGVVIPRGQTFYESLASASPPINQSQVTITSADIIR